MTIKDGLETLNKELGLINNHILNNSPYELRPFKTLDHFWGINYIYGFYIYNKETSKAVRSLYWCIDPHNPYGGLMEFYARYRETDAVIISDIQEQEKRGAQNG